MSCDRLSDAIHLQDFCTIDTDLTWQKLPRLDRCWRLCKDNRLGTDLAATRCMARTSKAAQSLSVVTVERKILLVRGHKVLLDAHLADLYGVETRALVQAVRRNPNRFPPDFMFRLTAEEATRLRSQIVISNPRGGRRYVPYVFTEQGVAMLSSVLRSPRAIQVNVQIMRAFVRLREMLAAHAELLRKIEAMERKYDARFRTVFEAIRELMTPPAGRPRRQIGFKR